MNNQRGMKRDCFVAGLLLCTCMHFSRFWTELVSYTYPSIAVFPAVYVLCALLTLAWQIAAGWGPFVTGTGNLSEHLRFGVASACVANAALWLTGGLVVSDWNDVVVLCAAEACMLAVLVLSAGRFYSTWPAAGLSRRTRFVCLAFLLGAGVCGAVIGTVELISAIALNRSPATGPVMGFEGDYLGSHFFEFDKEIGQRLAADRTVHCVRTADSKVLWDVSYSTDEFGRRTTIRQDYDGQQKHAVFFGCSYLFGEGSTDAETIPSQFAKLQPEYHAYNYGVPGFGTQHMLALLESDRIRNEVVEQSGIAVYLYLQEIHESRVIGGMQEFLSFAPNYPFYELESDGTPVRRGDFASGRVLTNAFYRIAAASNFVRVLGLSFPARSDSHYRLTASLILQSRRLYQQQFPESDFVVVAWYGTKTPTLQYLEEAGVSVCYPLSRPDHGAPNMEYAGDGHPTPLANRFCAEDLVTFMEDMVTFIAPSDSDKK